MRRRPHPRGNGRDPRTKPPPGPLRPSPSEPRIARPPALVRANPFREIRLVRPGRRRAIGRNPLAKGKIARFPERSQPPVQRFPEQSQRPRVRAGVGLIRTKPTHPIGFPRTKPSPWRPGREGLSPNEATAAGRRPWKGPVDQGVRPVVPALTGGAPTRPENAGTATAGPRLSVSLYGCGDNSPEASGGPPIGCIPPHPA